MKKVFIISALVLFAGTVSASNYAQSNSVNVEITKNDDDKKKKKKRAACSKKTSTGKSCCSHKKN